MVTAKEEFRRKVRETREREWVRDAIRAREHSGEDTLQQGLDLIKFALRFRTVGEYERYE